MGSVIKISNKKGVALIDIEGIIGVPERMQFDKPEERVATYEKFTRSLNKIALIDVDEVVVNIRSTGGDVNDALLIYEALNSLKANVTTRCYGYVASAATIIAQAASPGCREISPNTLYLIHCSESSVEGNSRSVGTLKEMLDKTDEHIAGIYAQRSGREAGIFAALMNENSGKGKWLSATEAVDTGLADRIIVGGRNTDTYFSAATGSAEMASIFEMLGLPDIPEDAAELSECGDVDENIQKGALGVLWRMFLSYFGIKAKNDATELGKERVGVEAKNVVKNNDSGEVGVARLYDGQMTAHPTITKPKDDPSPTEYIRTPNQEAYELDARNIRVG